MENKKQDILLEIINSPSAYHASHTIQEILKKAGFMKLNAQGPWNLSKGGRYFIQQSPGALLAFSCGNMNKPRLIAVHTDSPGFRIKVDSMQKVQGASLYSTEVYGSPLLSSWQDRLLRIAGLVYLKDPKEEHAIDYETFDWPEVEGIFPQLSLHLNRDVNKGFEYNTHKHFKLFFPPQSQELKERLEQDYGQRLLSYELIPYDAQKAQVSQDWINSGRLDNLALTAASLEALTQIESDSFCAGLFFDHEEIGSLTNAGAHSTWFIQKLERIFISLGHTRLEFLEALTQSRIISADAAHGFHPLFGEKFDETLHPVILGGGPVLKKHAQRRYSTEAEGEAWWTALCQKQGIPFQKQLMRSDVPTGTTIGPLLSSLMGASCIDVGIALWAMHSCRETASWDDYQNILHAMKGFYAT